ncbi:HRDC domain-containing protein [Paenibacillus sp.]|uniref:HRDC domain-containing protein n=1 Tax=Paenibacillus sp. TaxID=58172 RepID=UPI002D73B568|nr:HRDC domain-containing protein [Paenibacillus sp.]HZG55199.1 HRDC domain-containing protein [Paenibacillus sp.]
MNWVFMNSLQKRTEDDRVVQAQVTIGEDAGVWHVYWNEPGPDGDGVETCWFEGAGWNDMLTAFRGRLLEKMSEGYAPLLDNVTGDVQSTNGRTEWIQKLQYYGDAFKNEGVYEALREWRRKQAGKEGKAPYMIGTNRLFGMLAAFLPRTEDELLQIPGFGPFKAKLYGKELLAITGAAPRETTFPLDWVADRIDYAQYKLWLHQQQEAFQEREKQRKAQRNAVLEAALNGTDLETLKTKSQLPRREALALLEELEKEGYDVEPVIAVETKELPAEEQARVMALFAQTGDRYLKPILQKLNEEAALWKDTQADRAYEWLRLLRIRFRRQKESKLAG